MAEKLYSVVWGRWRFSLSIGGKTLLAFLMIVSFLAGSFYYFTAIKLTSQVESEYLDDLYSKLKGASRIYRSKLEQMRLGLLQAASEDEVKRAVAGRDGRFLKRLLRGYASSRPYVDLWAVVDKERNVIGRVDGRTGGLLDINGVVSKALDAKEAVLSTEAVEKEMLARESPLLASRVDDEGLMQVAVVPVEAEGKIAGAFVTGILLNKNGLFPDSVYRDFNIASAIFHKDRESSKIISSISSTSDRKGIFGPAVLPDAITRTVSQRKKFVGKAVHGGEEVYMAAEPVLDMKGTVVGGIAVGVYGDEVRRPVITMKNTILLITSAGVIFSLLLAGLIYRDTSKPINAITAAMDDTAGGDLDVRVDIKTKDEFEKIGRGFNHMVRSIKVREERLNSINDLSKILIASLEPDELLRKSLARMMMLTGSHKGIVYLHDEEKEMLIPVAWHGVDEGELSGLDPLEGLAGKCALSRRAAIHLDTWGSKSGRFENVFSEVPPGGLACFPMCCNERLTGVFATGRLAPYTQDDISHIGQLVTQISIAADNAIVHKEIERLSIADPLTGLFNRRHFFKLLEKEFAGSRRYRYELAVMMIDIDNFKSINDRYGHQQGDKVLSEVSGLLKTRTRSTDVWARYGGEEFVGFITHCSPEGIGSLAEKLRAGVEELIFPEMKGERVTVSIGVGFYPREEIKSVDDVIKEADERLYTAKRSGRNMVIAA